MPGVIYTHIVEFHSSSQAWFPFAVDIQQEAGDIREPRGEKFKRLLYVFIFFHLETYKYTAETWLKGIPNFEYL